MLLVVFVGYVFFFKCFRSLFVYGLLLPFFVCFVYLFFFFFVFCFFLYLLNCYIVSFFDYLVSYSGYCFFCWCLFKGCFIFYLIKFMFFFVFAECFVC